MKSSINAGTLWFDRLRNRLREETSEERKGTLSLMLEGYSYLLPEILKDLNEARPLVISSDVSKRIAPNGEASEDLKQGFSVPFDPAFIELDPAVKLPELRGQAVRGILVRKIKGTDSLAIAEAVAESAQIHEPIYIVHVWVERGGKAFYEPAMSFYFVPSKGWTGEVVGSEEDFTVNVDVPEHRQVMNFLIWLTGYINSPNVLAIRHNRRHDLVRSYEQRGLLPPSSYYTFEPERSHQPSKRRMSKAATVDVRGHFRRAHWHRLPGGGSAWFGTTWVRPYKRLSPSGGESVQKAA